MRQCEQNRPAITKAISVKYEGFHTGKEWAGLSHFYLFLHSIQSIFRQNLNIIKVILKQLKWIKRFMVSCCLISLNTTATQLAAQWWWNDACLPVLPCNCIIIWVCMWDGKACTSCIHLFSLFSFQLEVRTPTPSIQQWLELFSQIKYKVHLSQCSHKDKKKLSAIQV